MRTETGRNTVSQDLNQLQERIEGESDFVRELQNEIGRVVVGQRGMVDALLIGLLTGGHVLLEGVPGLAKTLSVSTLARALAMSFARIQFTPDLLPADLIGTLIYDSVSSRNYPVVMGSMLVAIGFFVTCALIADLINAALDPRHRTSR